MTYSSPSSILPGRVLCIPPTWEAVRADDAYAIALDRAGNAYITGRTNSSDFPLVNPIQVTRVAFDMFVTEINAAGSATLFSTFLGGSASESGRGIAVDSLGNIHIAGESTSTDFPVVNAVQMTSGGAQDGIVLLFATRLPYLFNDFAGKGCSDGELLYDASTGQSYTALTNGDGTYSYISQRRLSRVQHPAYGRFYWRRQSRSHLVQLPDCCGFISALAKVMERSVSRRCPGFLDMISWTPAISMATARPTSFCTTAIPEPWMPASAKVTAPSPTSYQLLSPYFTYVRLADFTGDGNADLFLYRAADGLSFLGVGDGTGGFTFNALSLAPWLRPCRRRRSEWRWESRPDPVLQYDRTGCHGNQQRRWWVRIHSYALQPWLHIGAFSGLYG